MQKNKDSSDNTRNKATVKRTKTRNGFTLNIPVFDPNSQGPILIRKLDSQKPAPHNKFNQSADLNNQLGFAVTGNTTQIMR